MDFKILPFELKSASGDGSEFAGFCNAFCNIDAAQEIVAPGAFKDTIPQFMEVGFIGGLNHDWNSPIGSPVSAEEQSAGLFVEGKISPTQHGKDCMVLLKDRVVKKMSIGYKVLGDMMLENAEDVAAWWKDQSYTPNASDIAAAQYGARVLTKVHLYEFSPVTVPANSMADITRVKQYSAAEISNKRAFEAFLRDSGLSRKEAVEVIAVLFKGLQREADEATSPETETPPTETEPPPADPPEPQTEDTEITQPPIEAAVVVSDAPVVEKADSREVSALYATFLTRQARLHALNR